MGLIDKVYSYDRAVYWPPLAPNSFGRVTYGTPVEIGVRWTDITEEIKNADGALVISQATIFASQDVEVGGMMLHSELDSSVDQDNPRNNAGAWEILGFSKIPNKKATKFLRKVYL